MSELVIRAADAGDAAATAAIFREGIEDRLATFETEPPTAPAMAVIAGSNRPALVAERDHVRHGRLDDEWRDVLVAELLLGEAAA